MMRIVAGVFILVSISVSAVADWPQYLGPDRNAIGPDTSVSRNWPSEGPEQAWSVSLGPGFGGASVHGDEVFILDRIAEKADVMRCFDLNSGEEKWRVSYDAAGEYPYPGSRTVPTVDEEYVWSVGAFGDLYCFSREAHEVVWNTNIVEAYEVKVPHWGITQSPLLYKDLVIVAPQGAKAGVVAYDKRTGEVRWESRPLKGYAWCVSPILATFGGIDQVITTSPYDKENPEFTNEVVSLDASSGEVLWSFEGLHSFATIAPPLVIDDTRLLLVDGSYDGDYKPVTIMVDVRRKDDSFTVTELWKTEEAGSKIHPPVLHEGYLYLNSGSRGDHMQCLSLDGKSVWSDGPAFSLGSLILLGDVIVSQDGKRGDVRLIEATPSGYKELAKAELFGSRKNTPWAPLAFSDGKLLIRDDEEMVCLVLKNPG